VYGHGRIDAYEAVYAALGYPPQVNLPWLSEAPISGTLDAGEGVAVQVSFDSTGLAEGAYNGALGILSSDPVQPFFSVPVTMNVVLPTGPVIMFNWQSFFETLPVGGMLTDTLTISNAGDAMLTFTLYEVSATHMLMSPPVEFSIPEPTPNVGPVQVEASVNTQLIFLGHARLILYLRNQPDLSAAYAIPDRARRVQYVYDRLLETATLSDDLYNWLVSQGAEPRRLLATNAIAATLDEAQLDTVLGFPQVGRVGVNGQVEILQNSPANGVWQQSPISLPDTIEWNIAQIGADQVWSTFGIRGEGVVIGVVDTGVAYTHLALNAQYRGNLGGGNYDHNYNWYDLVNGNPMPYDDNNHGTFGTGIAVGDDGGDNQIGVAPGAQWIAVKALDANGNGSYENLHAALAWVIAPTDVYGENPDPSLAPQVVLNMWSISSFNCDHAFDADLVALRAANILPVFSPGAEGPGCGTVGTPAADPNAFSAGATDNNDVIASFSANGPSCYDGTTIKPDLVAPGVNVRSSTANGSYQVWSGTASSAAHLAGASALLFSADPGISLDDLEQTLFDTAVCHEQLACGGDPCPLPNNTYGYGRIDVFQAVSSTLAPPYDIPWLVAGPFSGELAPGQSVDIPVIFNASGMQPGSYQGGIAVGSNDPLVPFTILPVDLTVVDFYRIVLPIINK
jgi:subtilisin family serine protease